MTDTSTMMLLGSSTQSEKKVYRYNFRTEFVALLFRFSRVHQYDSSDDFKDAFEKWEITYSTEIKLETEYLQSIGYVGDFREKTYKSARYYFRKKSIGVLLETTTETSNPVTSTQRKKYTSIDFDLNEIRYYKNGKDLGVAFRANKFPALHPCIR